MVSCRGRENGFTQCDFAMTLEQLAPKTPRPGDSWSAPPSVARWIGRHLLGVQLDKGRIRFGGLNATERRLTVAAVVAVGTIILLLLFPGIVPSSHTVPLYPNPAAQSVDSAGPALILLALGFLVSLLVFAASRCPRTVRVIVAVGLLLISAQSAKFIGEDWNGVLPVFILASYIIAPLALVVSATEGSKLASRLPSWWSRLVALAPWAAVSGVVVFFLGCVLLYVIGLHDARYQVSVYSSFVADIAIPIQYTLNNFYSAFLVLFVLASLAVVRFAYGIGQVVAGFTRRLPMPWARWGLLALIALEAFFVLRRYPGSDWFVLQEYPQIAVLSALSIGLFAWMTFGARQLLGIPRHEVETERVSMLGALAYSLPYVVVGFLISASWVEAVFFPGKDGSTAVFNIFTWLNGYAEDNGFQIGAAAVFFAVLVIVGMRHAANGDSIERRQAAFGLALVSGWALWTYIVAFIAPLALYSVLLNDVTLLVTAAVTVYLVRNWKGHSPNHLAFMAGVVVLGWLVSSDGGFLSIVGGWVGLHNNVPLAFGTVLTIIGASEFTGGTSRRLPRRSRPLVWLSYIGISLLFKLWFQLSHGVNVLQGEYRLDTTLSYLVLAPPFAAWLVLTGWFKEEESPRQVDEAVIQPPTTSTPTTVDKP
jgi:hypothetical protein